MEEGGGPGRVGAARFRITIEREIGSDPGGIDKIAEVGKVFQKIWREKCGGGKNNEFGLKLGVAGEDACAAAGLRNAVHYLAGADVAADALEETAGDPAVAFGPCEGALFLGLPGRKIKKARPSPRVGREGARVV